MRTTTKTSLVLALLALTCLLLPGLAGCSQPAGTDGGDASASASTGGNPSATPAPSSSTGSAGIISVIDQTGTLVQLDKPAERVVALTASACEIAYALGAGEAVVGRGEYCDWPAEVLALPVVQSGADTNIEQIIALDPDLVVMATMAQNPEQARQLAGAGIAVYSSDATDIAQTYESIEQLGVLLGKDEAAADIIAQMQATFAEIAAQKVSGTIYFEVSPLELGLWASGSNTFMNEVAEMMGLENIFADVDGWAQVSEEQVLQRNPDYILTVGMYTGQGPRPEEEVLARANWRNISAVKNGAVLNLPDNELARPGPRLADGAKKLHDFVLANS